MGLDIAIGQVELTLLGGCGVYWRKHDMLLVADTHLGKEATFRRHGVPVPRGSTHGTLSRISEMLLQTGAKSLVILGDMFHARSSLAADVRESVAIFLASHDTVEVSLVLGNHDLHVGKLPQEWPLRVVDPGWIVEGVALGHHPGLPPAGAELLLCGHVHSAVRMSSASDDLGKLPCFWLSNQCFVLPAIGEFTGTHVVRPAGRDRVWVIADNRVMAVR